MLLHAIYPASKIFPFIDKGNRYKLLAGYSVRINSSALRMFKKSPKCKHCGVEGNTFVLLRDKKTQTSRPHLAFFHKQKNGTLLLMTKDHVLPKSKGGENRQENIQTLCQICNGAKGNKVEGTE